MSKERELLKEALKVLEWNGIMGSHDTYNSIKELLAQPEQEFVAWIDYNRQKRFQWEPTFPKDIWFKPLASMYTRKRRR